MIKFLTRDKVFLAILLIIALALRLDFLIPVNYVIDSDEAIVGLMAKHITEGAEIPTFYYGQHYMGSLEPILVSVVFKIFGPSNAALKVVPLVFSLFLVIAIYLLAYEIGGRFTANIAALLTAIPPNPLVVWSGKARGGFIEILVIGAAALYIAVRWLKKENPSIRDTFFVGLLLGLGWWVNNQIVYFMLPIGLFFLMRLGLRKPAFKHFISGLLAFFIGGLPFWIYNFSHSFASFQIFGRSEARDLWDHISGLFSTSIPIIIGAKKFWAYDDIFTDSTIIYYAAYLIFLAIIIKDRRTEIGNLVRLKISQNPAVELYLLLVVTACCVFALSSYGSLVHAPRYLLPLYVVFMPLIGFALAKIEKKSPIISFSFLFLMIFLNVISNYSYGRAIPGEPFVYKQQRVTRDHTELINWLDQHNITWVRTNYWIGYKLAFESNERIKFDMFQEPLQVRIPSYQKEALKIGLEEMPLILTPAQAALVQKAMHKLKYTFKSDLISGYKVIHDIQMPRHDLEPLDVKELSVETKFNSDIAYKAIDDDETTRWGTAHFQTSDMSFSINLKKATDISGLRYNLGTWGHDWPRALKVEVVNSKGEKREVFEDEAYLAVRYYTQDNVCFSLFFDAPDTVKVNLYQVGKDPIFDWSIAELDLLKAVSAK